MNLRLRSEPGKRLRVLDEAGNEIAGILSVSFRADGKNPVPVVTIECLAEIVADVEATVERAPKPARGAIQAKSELVKP